MLQGVLLCIIPMLDPSAVPNDCEFLPVCESDLPGNFVLFAQMAPLDFDSTCLYFSIIREISLYPFVILIQIENNIHNAQVFVLLASVPGVGAGNKQVIAHFLNFSSFQFRNLFIQAATMKVNNPAGPQFASSVDIKIIGG